MDKFVARCLQLLSVCLVTAVSVSAQDWKSAVSLPGVDLTGLTETQKNTVLKLIRDQDCSCACGMKVAECRVKDPNCYYSRGMASVIAAAIKSGASETDALAAAASSKFGKGPVEDNRVLGDPVQIPTAGSPSIGRPDARITLVEFSDFQCPFCIAAVPEIKNVLKTYPNDVKLIFKQFPLEMHSQAALAAAGALAAYKQNKFWEMHDALFADRRNLSRAGMLAVAAKLGLDVKRFESDLDAPETRKAVVKDMDDGDRVGVQGTPTLFIDGKLYRGPITLEAVKPLLEAELKQPPSETKTATAATKQIH
jgi:protein-disulfide isomerase